MDIPDFQSLMLPVLLACRDGEIGTAQLRERIATTLTLGEEELAEMLPSGRVSTFANRVAWAITYLQIAGLLERTRRGVYQLTDECVAILKHPPPRIDMKFLERYPSYVDWRHGSASKETAPGIPAPSAVEPQVATPEELMGTSYQTHLAALQGQLLQHMRGMPDSAFESLVVDLLIAMGYGGGRREMGRAVGKSGDGGIDGIIREDALGLDIVYLQAKKYSEGYSVGRPEVQAFAGSLDGVGATKGLFFSTSAFTETAKGYVDRIHKRIVLIDGKEIARLMVEHNVGVRQATTYVIKRIDEEYFGE